MHFEVNSETELPKTKVISTPAKDYSAAKWSKKEWNVLDGKKVNGAGKGYFEYEIVIPKSLSTDQLKEAYFLVEASAKELFVKDQEEYNKNQDFMKGSRVAPSSNPNSYPMTDETFFPSTITISINGQQIPSMTLADDPADHRGVLSWHHQLKDGKLREAGSYGYLLKVNIDTKSLKQAVESGNLTVRLQTEGEGGIAIYGKSFGRFPIDPCLVLKY
jgi:hypothetical protein